MPRKKKQQEEESTEEEKSSWKDPVRELALMGLATVLMTEDSIRQKIKDLKLGKESNNDESLRKKLTDLSLPKEMVSAILDSAAKKKGDLYSLIAREVAQLIAKVDLGQEVKSFLENHRIRFEANVTFEPTDKVKADEKQEEKKDADTRSDIND